MWRWISGFPRAIRQHFHGPRAATGVCREEELEQSKDVPKKRCIHDKQELGLFARSSRYQKEENSDHGPDQDKWYRNYKKDFCSFIYGNCNALEALGWGAAVVLGIHFSKCPLQNDEYKRRRSEETKKRCFLWQVAYALPDTRKSIVSSDKQKNVVKTEDDSAKVEDPLHKVMNDFEDICKKYAGIGKNIQGLQEAAKDKFTNAISNWVDASHLGYTKSQFNLGLCYETGKGVNVNLRKAEKYYKLAAEEGHSQALYNLALLYLKGEGCIEKNVPLAIELLHKAAEIGLCQAQTHLGVYYTDEETQDLEKAVAFFQAAAEQNEPEAQYFLGVCYEEGLGIEVNECKSAELYAKAAEKGHDGAMYNLGVFHELALGGIEKDNVRALLLYQKAAECGNEQAKVQLDRFKATSAIDEWEYINRDAADYKSVMLHGEREVEKPPVSPKLNTSISSPSLTDYVRNHLDSFSSTLPINVFDPISLLKNNSIHKSSSLTVESSPKLKTVTTELELSSLIAQISTWTPQYTSSQVMSESHEKVSFMMGADEDDMDGLLSLKTQTDDLSTDVPIQHFCSFIQKNSTMPDLNYVSCN